MRACQSLVYAESSTVGGLPVLSPQPIVDLLNQLDNMLKKLEEAVMDIIKDVDGKKKVRQLLHESPALLSKCRCNVLEYT